MASSAICLLFIVVFLFPSSQSLFQPSQSAKCTSQAFYGKKMYEFCTDLPALNAFLHWTYHSAQSTLSIAFIAPPAQPDGWVSWAINPTGTGMLGSQALIAFKDAGGKMTVRTYNISSYGLLVESNVWYQVKEPSAEYSGGVIRLFATLVLPEKGLKTVTHVWQVGASVTNGVPDKHVFLPGNKNSRGSLYLLRGRTDEGGGVFSGTWKAYVHGGLNLMSWGIMFPVGILGARYLKAFPSTSSTWFRLHFFFMPLGYIFGFEGWLIGLELDSEFKGATYSCHRTTGTALVVLANLQMFGLLLKPQRNHGYRFYWNVYHRRCGYTILILGIINVFKGLDILRPELWRTACAIVLGVLGGIAIFLEAITYWRKKFSASTMPHDVFNNGENSNECEEEPLLLIFLQDLRSSDATYDSTTASAADVLVNRTPPRSLKRSRDAEVCNLPEKRRRTRICENMNKDHKELDETIERLKQLELTTIISLNSNT